MQTIEEVKKVKYYSQAHREAQQRYRDKNREKYNQSQRELYSKLHSNEEWKQMFNERSKKNNLAYRQKKREKFLAENPTVVIRGRGRPRKQVSEPVSEIEVL